MFAAAPEGHGSRRAIAQDAVATARPDYHWVLIGPRQREHALLADPDFWDLSPAFVAAWGRAPCAD